MFKLFFKRKNKKEEIKIEDAANALHNEVLSKLNIENYSVGVDNNQIFVYIHSYKDLKDIPLRFKGFVVAVRYTDVIEPL